MAKTTIGAIESFPVNDRVKAIVAWLLHNSERVGRPDNVQIVFNCAGTTASVEVKEREPVPAQY